MQKSVEKSALFVVGIGPGSMEFMTIEAKNAIEKSSVIVGYTKYIDLIKNDFSEKEFFSTGMMSEVDRCKKALEFANNGKIVSLVCSGDSGVYGMASLILELSSEMTEFCDVEIQIVPGVTAALSGAARLGSPFTADFCVISLSNLLMPLEKIEKRLRAAASGDFPVALYNPRSKNRPDALKNACEILLETLPPETICGWVKNIGREGEESHFCTLEELKSAELDMFCTVFVGNSDTKFFQQGGKSWMVNPRGYKRVNA